MKKLRFGVPFGLHLGSFGHHLGSIQAVISGLGPACVPGEAPGTIFGDFGGHFGDVLGGFGEHFGSILGGLCMQKLRRNLGGEKGSRMQHLGG